jgi:hypothetical protein
MDSMKALGLNEGRIRPQAAVCEVLGKYRAPFEEFMLCCQQNAAHASFVT